MLPHSEQNRNGLSICLLDYGVQLICSLLRVLTRVDIRSNLLKRAVVTELKKMSYATGLRPRSPWLLLCGTIKTDLVFRSAFSPEEAAREDGDRVFQIHPFLSPTKPSLCLVMKYKTLHRLQKNISQSSSLPRDFLKFWKLQPTVFKQSQTYLCL